MHFFEAASKDTTQFIFLSVLLYFSVDINNPMYASEDNNPPNNIPESKNQITIHLIVFVVIVALYQNRLNIVKSQSRIAHRMRVVMMQSLFITLYVFVYTDTLLANINISIHL